MKRIISLVLVMMFFISIPSYATSNPTIRVNGQGKVSLKPDICTIEFSSVSRDKNQSKALEDNTSKNNKLLDSFKKAGIKDEDIVTEDFNLREEYNYNKDGSIGEKTYVVTNTTQLTLRDLSKIGQFIELGINSGADSVGYLRYNSSKSNEAYGQALNMAINNAKSKTDTISKAIGVKVKGISLVEETSNNYYGRVETMNAKMAGESKDLQIDVKDLEINANILMESIY